MKARICPHCGDDELVFTGAFWSCDHCGYAVTSGALAADADLTVKPGGCSSQNQIARHRLR